MRIGSDTSLTPSATSRWVFAQAAVSMHVILIYLCAPLFAQRVGAMPGNLLTTIVSISLISDTSTEPLAEPTNVDPTRRSVVADPRVDSPTNSATTSGSTPAVNTAMISTIIPHPSRSVATPSPSPRPPSPAPIFLSPSEVEKAAQPISEPDVMMLNGAVNSGLPIRVRAYIDRSGNVVDVIPLSVETNDESAFALIAQMLVRTKFNPARRQSANVASYKDLEFKID